MIAAALPATALLLFFRDAEGCVSICSERKDCQTPTPQSTHDASASNEGLDP
jgi:hypothetical protein